MKFFIKEWSDDTATLMTEHGQVVWTFSSVQEAVEGCAEWVGVKNPMPKLAKVEFKDRLDTAA